ncbi:unnamed protein product [Ascophyllum nodosum]
MAGGFADTQATGGGGQRSKDKQSILPVNVKQVIESEMTSQESGAKIDGVEVAQVKLVGCIVEMENASTNTEYTIEDTTGRLKVKIFHNDGEGGNDRSAERRSRNQIGTYVRVFGNVRSWKDDRHSVAYDMQPISDFNEVTMHVLETIYTHLFLTKGPLPGKASVGGGAAVAQPNHGVGSPGLNRNSLQRKQGFNSPTQINSSASKNPSMHQQSSTGFTPLQQKVLDMFLGADDEQGRSTHDVIAVLQDHHVSAHQISEAISFLSSEGHLYSTIDEDHYKSTEN